MRALYRIWHPPILGMPQGPSEATVPARRFSGCPRGPLGAPGSLPGLLAAGPPAWPPLEACRLRRKPARQKEVGSSSLRVGSPRPSSFSPSHLFSLFPSSLPLPSLVDITQGVSRAWRWRHNPRSRAGPRGDLATSRESRARPRGGDLYRIVPVLLNHST